MNLILSLIITIVGAVLAYLTFAPAISSMTGSVTGGILGQFIGSETIKPDYTKAMIFSIILIIGIVMFLFGLWQFVKTAGIYIMEKLGKVGKRLEGYESHAAATVKKSGVAQKVSVF